MNEFSSYIYCECLGTTWTGNLNPARDPIVFFRTHRIWQMQANGGADVAHGIPGPHGNWRPPGSREPGQGATAVAVTRMLAQAAATGILLPRHRSAAVMTRPPRVACATSGPGYFLSLASGQPRATQVKKEPVSDFRSKAYQ